MSRYRELIENILKEYDPDDEGDKTWTTSSEWNNYYNQKKLKSLERKTDDVRIVCISSDLTTGEEIRKIIENIKKEIIKNEEEKLLC